MNTDTEFKDGPDQILHLIVRYLLTVAQHSDPQAFKAFLMGGVLTNTVAGLPEKYFEEMVKVKPCYRQGCDCHLLAEEAHNLLTKIREDHQRHSGMLHPE